MHERVIMHKSKNQGRGRRPLSRTLLAGLVLVAPLSACIDTEEILRVEDPQFASPGSLRNTAGLPTLVAGAIGDFHVAYSGSGGDAFLSVTSILSDEFYTSDTFTTRIATDQREQQPTASGNTSDAAYSRLQNARRSLAEAADAVREFGAGDKDPRLAEIKALEGLTYVALAEGFCAPIPFSNAVQGVPGEAGQPLSRDEVFRAGVQRFDAALAVDPNNNLAKVGKGRALLGLGDYAAAAQAVRGVPTGFVYFIRHSANSGRQFNPLFSLQSNGRYSMSDREGGNGLPYRSARDPRLPWVGPRPGFDASVPQFINRRYPSFDSDVPLAGGVEARLIEAEAALNKGASGAYLAILNDLRTQVRSIMTARFENYASIVPPSGGSNVAATLAPLTDPGNPQDRVSQFFQERAFWLYTTGKRLGDMRRLVRQYGRPQNQVFPTGAYHKGGVYGNEVSFPIPFDEQNNPNYNPSQCNTTEA